MFLLRRAAVRAAITQPSRQLSTLRPASTRVTTFQSKPNLYRPFHQTLIWRADEQEKRPEEVAPVEVETVGETVPPESTAEEVEDLKDESIAAAAVAEAAAEVAEEAAAQPAQDIAEAAADTANAAAGAANTAAAAAAAQDPPPVPEARTPFGSDSGATAGSSFRDAQPSRILYVGNLFFEVTAPQLEAEFARFGEVTNSRVVTDNRGLSKGFAYVEFANQDAADRAMRELDQRVFQGRRMAVQYHVRRERQRGTMGGAKGAAEPSKTLFIGNMSYQMSDRDLNDLFREIRDVLDVRVAIDRRSGQPRGFAHADFIDIPSAVRAKEHLETKIVYGRQLRVDFSGQSNRNSNPGGQSA